MIPDVHDEVCGVPYLVQMILHGCAREQHPPLALQVVQSLHWHALPSQAIDTEMVPSREA